MSKRDDCSTPPFGTDKAIDPKTVEADSTAPTETVVFCGDSARVMTGFVLALQLMGMMRPSAIRQSAETER